MNLFHFFNNTVQLYYPLESMQNSKLDQCVIRFSNEVNFVLVIHVQLK